MGKTSRNSDGAEIPKKQSLRKAAGSKIEMILLAAVTIVAIVVTLLTAITVDIDKVTDYCKRYRGIDTTPVVVTNGNSAKFNSAEQRAIIKQIVDIGNARNMGYRGIMLALMVAMQESRIKNLKYGHLDSLGIYQQRPSQGWGTPEQILDPEYAIGKFYDALEAVQGWQSMSYLDAALAVQRPSREAYLSADNYFPGWEPVAAKILNSPEDEEEISTVIEPVDIVTQLCDRVLLVYGDEQSKLEKILLAALSRVGDEYEWDEPYNGGAFICWAFKTEDVDVPCEVSDHAVTVGDKKLGVAVEQIEADDVRSGEVTLRPGDVILTSDKTDSNDPKDANAIGMFAGGQGSPEFKIATYNIKTGDGYPARVQAAAQVIPAQQWDIVGFQETEIAPIFNALKTAFEGTKYAMYPSDPKKIYRNGPNSRVILYNTERFEPVINMATGEPKVDEILFKRMEGNGEPQPAHAPIIWLRDKLSGQEIIVTNTHSPAFRRFTLERKEAGEAYAEKMIELKAEGLPIFFTGDFNSGPWVDQDGYLPTWQGDRNNLAYCQLTAIQPDGKPLMQNARDVYDGIADRNNGYCPRNKGEGAWSIDHIYTTLDVEVSMYGEVSRETTLSDHDVNWASVSIPGSFIIPPVGSNNELLVASYNVLGSSHTTGPNDTPGVERIERQTYKLITSKQFAVVGLQEIQRDQRKRLRELLGEGWGIWPNEPTYTDDGGAVHADNSIIWDKSQVEFVRGTSLPMPLYFSGERKIPVVELKHLASGQNFYVADTHDPAKPENAYKRFLAANQHAGDSEELAAELPLFFVGDFNSGFAVRNENNTTYGGDRNNLTWCIMTKSGTMHNAYDGFKGRTGPCPKETSTERGVGPVDHIYMSRDIRTIDYQEITDRATTGSDHPVVYVRAALPSATEVTSQELSADSLGQFVGPDPTTGVISIQEVDESKLVGVIRYTLTLPEYSGSGVKSLPIAKGVYTLTNRFGECASYYQACHTGLDFAAPDGTPIMAISGGEISSADYAGAFGNRIVIQADDGSEVEYSHQSRFAVESGHVEAGQVIGYVGNTGNVLGANGGYHLHLEVHVNGAAIDPFDFLVRHGLNP